MPGGYGTANLGVTGDLPTGSNFTFGVPAENTNFLSTGRRDGKKRLYLRLRIWDLEGDRRDRTSVSRSPARRCQARPRRPSRPRTSSSTSRSVPGGLTGYLNGGWTGVGSGSPNAFGYIDPSDTGSVYIAPNITFDFSEVEFQDKSAGSAELDWEDLFNQLLRIRIRADDRVALARLWPHRLADERPRNAASGLYAPNVCRIHRKAFATRATSS